MKMNPFLVAMETLYNILAVISCVKITKFKAKKTTSCGDSSDVVKRHDKDIKDSPFWTNIVLGERWIERFAQACNSSHVLEYKKRWQAMMMSFVYFSPEWHLLVMEWF